MIIDLYINNSENNAFTKNLTLVYTLNGTLRESVSILNPSIDFNFDGIQMPTINYVFIPDFKRYYFVKNITSIRTNLWRYDLHVDVLSSFKDEILANTGTVARQENQWNMYLDDGTFRAYSNPLIQMKKFPNQNLLNDNTLVLIVAGGIAN